MIGSLTIIFWTIVVLGGYILFTYSKSRNRKLLFKDGPMRAFVWSLGMITTVGTLIWMVIPESPIDLNNLKFHSEEFTRIIEELDQKDLTYYFYQSATVFTEMHLLGFFSALLILGIWFYYIRNLDFFQQESIAISFYTLLISMAITFFTFPLSDYVHQVFQIEYSDNTFYNLFVYCFIGIGFVEELIKIIPVLIILNYTDEIDEPYDLIYYACISALGFAFIENLLYFRDVSGSIVISRALTSAIGHMVFASVAAYGIVLYKFREERQNFLVIYFHFLLGAFFHALYDYFLFENLLILYVPFFIFSVQVWAILINNTMNNSKYFSYSTLQRFEDVKFRLALFLVGLMLINFLFNGFLSGRELATESFVWTLAINGLLIIFYVSKMSSIDLVKDYWRPVRFRVGQPNDSAFPGSGGLSSVAEIFKANTIIPANHVGKKIKLHCPRSNRHLQEFFITGSGKIVDRIKLKRDKKNEDVDWFLVKLDEPLGILKIYEDQFIMIKILNKYESLIHDLHIKCLLKVIPKGLTHKKDDNYDSYLSYGFIMINGGDYQFD